MVVLVVAAASLNVSSGEADAAETHVERRACSYAGSSATTRAYTPGRVFGSVIGKGGLWLGVIPCLSQKFRVEGQTKVCGFWGCG